MVLTELAIGQIGTIMRTNLLSKNVSHFHMRKFTKIWVKMVIVISRIIKEIIIVLADL